MSLVLLKLAFYQLSYLSGNYLHAKYDIKKYKNILTTMYLTFDIDILIEAFYLKPDSIHLVGQLWNFISFFTVFCGLFLILSSARVCKKKLYFHGFYPFRSGIYEHISDPFYYGKALLIMGISIYRTSVLGILLATFMYSLSNAGIAFIEKKYTAAWIKEIEKSQRK
eukprot:NODE_930_length_3034_cov_1.043271.p3 type:complete len:167 gc:universal NODE_930_length_3034_cov_1.043271:1864-2364(+)